MSSLQTNKRIMTHIPFYPTVWQSVPYRPYMPKQSHFNAIIPKKDVVLVNKNLLDQGVSEMTLHVNGLSAIDEHGNEHLISRFKTQTVNLKGMHSGLFSKTKDPLSLPEGQYKTLRWHFDTIAPISFVYNDRSEATFSEMKCLDFEIENGLKTKAGETYDLTLHFKFSPLTPINYLNELKEFFKKQSGFTKALSRSFGSF